MPKHLRPVKDVPFGGIDKIPIYLGVKLHKKPPRNEREWAFRNQIGEVVNSHISVTDEDIRVNFTERLTAGGGGQYRKMQN